MPTRSSTGSTKARRSSLIEAAFPGTTAGGKVDRIKLGQRVIGNAEEMKRLEALVHPLYRAAEQRFLAGAEKDGAKVAVLDVPLLFETGGADRVDAVVVVSAPEEVQHARLMERPGMTREKLFALLAKQMPDAEKRARADFVVDTSQGFDSARAQVRAILDKVDVVAEAAEGLTKAHARNRLRYRNHRPRTVARRPAGRDRLHRTRQPLSDRQDVSPLRQSGARHAGGGIRRARPVGGISAASIRAFAEVVEDFLAFVGDAPLIAHNASFDLGFHQRRTRARRPACCSGAIG